MTFRLLSVNPFLDTEEVFAGLELDEAAERWDDLTGEGPITSTENVHLLRDGEHSVIEWTDPETGREVILRPEVAI